jgi:hypothetical protein
VNARTAANSKYNAMPTTVDGVRFDSAAEAHRWSELLLLEKAGDICDISRQRPFPLYVVGAVELGRLQPYVRIGTYVADFIYTRSKDSVSVVEDVKGYRTPLYRWKKKHFEAQYGIVITEITNTRRRGSRGARRARRARV